VEQQVLCEIFAAALGVPAVSDDDDLFDLGGDSITATKVISQVRARLGVELDVRTLFKHPTAGGVSAQLSTLAKARPALHRTSGRRQ
jgi:aryl carrier-like protein